MNSSDTGRPVGEERVVVGVLGEGMRLTPSDLYQKTFRTVMRGADPKEVSAFLELVANEYTALLEKNRKLIEDNTYLRSKLNEYKEMESTIKNAMVRSQRLEEQIVEEARRQRDAIIDEANAKAEKLVSEAQQAKLDMEQEALAIRRDAEAQAETLRAEAEREVQALRRQVQEDVSDLRRQKEILRDELKTFLQSHLNLLSSYDESPQSAVKSKAPQPMGPIA